MGTLTKKLHILKSGGTEETCNIYTTPEEVGGSPYLALEVDGAKGYVKLGNTTDANATHLRVEKNGTTYAAWKQATVDVPTGNIIINRDSTFTVPSGINVIEIYVDALDAVVYVGVTPNTTHSIYMDMEQISHVRWGVNVRCSSHDKTYVSARFLTDEPDEDPSLVMRVSWSPEINERKPNVTDY